MHIHKISLIILEMYAIKCHFSHYIIPPYDDKVNCAVFLSKAKKIGYDTDSPLP